MVVGPYGDDNEITIIVGGNCFLQCFKINGDEQFWNVMSDQVTALALVSCDGHVPVMIPNLNIIFKTYNYHYYSLASYWDRGRSVTHL